MSPSSNLPSWSHFSKPQHGWLRPFLAGVLVGAVLVALLLAVVESSGTLRYIGMP